MSIPAGFRAELERQSERAPILTNLKDCLALYPHEAWVDFEQHLASVSATDPRIQAYRRFMVSGAVECPLDRQGRILVPPHLRQHAQLEREATIAGVGPIVEIWDKARFDAEMVHATSQFDDWAMVVGGVDKVGGAGGG
ncbi:MAG: division/cell wall cluster transcriptional repressor MraZ [Proteobacteria bacterium]|nr:division/cell wall cluster transcriptional repressor MraZ [Pseudomonadota bacterium]